MVSGPQNPQTSREALERARKHGRRAAGEAAAAFRALLDAASLELRGTPSDAQPLLRWIAKALDEVALILGDENHSQALLETIADALDAEIERWEERAASDPQARSVLRAFLGLREILWEMGIRRGEKGQQQPPRTRPSPPPSQRKRRPPPPVQRIPLEG